MLTRIYGVTRPRWVKLAILYMLYFAKLWDALLWVDEIIILIVFRLCNRIIECYRHQNTNSPVISIIVVDLLSTYIHHFQDNVFKNFVCEMAAILWRLRPLKFSVVGWLAFQWDMHICSSRLKDKGRLCTSGPTQYINTVKYVYFITQSCQFQSL